MKPVNWNSMTAAKKKDYAISLLESQRGQYILSQALYLGAEALRNVPPPHTEVSNIEDMDILQEIFGIYRIVKDAEKQFDKLPKSVLKKP